MSCTNALKLIVIPVTFVAVNLAYLSVLFPIFSGPPGYDQDPAYSYLFNGLLLIDGQGPWQVDHPGTPLQILSAGAILFARALFLIVGHPMNPGVVDDVLADAEPYLYVVSCLLLILNAGALCYLGMRVRRASGSLLLAFLCQVGGLAFGMVSPKASYVSPEALQIFATLCLLGQLAPLVFAVDRAVGATGMDETCGSCSAKWTGFFCGLGLAVKLTFFPLIGLTLMIQPLRKLLIVAGYAFVSLVVLLLPTFNNYARFLDWIWNIASHSGMHGSGQAKVIDPAYLIQNLRDVFIWFPALYYVMAALLAYVLFAAFRNFAGPNANRSLPIRFPILVLLVFVAQTLLVLKHPGAHYMVPILPLAFVGLAWLLFQLDSEMRRREPSRALRWHRLLVAIVIAYAAYCTAPTIRQIDRMREQRAAQDVALTVIGDQTQRYPDALVICAFRCTLPKYATALGLIYAPGLATRPIVRDLLANFYEYNFLVKEFIAPGFNSLTLGAMSEELARGRKIFLVTPGIIRTLLSSI